MIVAKYTGCGNQPNGTSRFCFSDCAACTSPGPPVIEPRCVAHATGNTLSTWRALPSRIACAARYGAVAAHAMPPPHGDVHISCDGAEVLVEHVDVEVGERARPREAVDVGRLEAGVGDRPLGGLDADLARGAARRLRVRGLADAGDRDLAAHVVEVGGVSPVAHAAETTNLDLDPSGAGVPSAAHAFRPRAGGRNHAHADRHRRDRPDDRLSRSRPPSLLRLPARQPARPRVARRVRVPRAVHVQERARRSRRSPTR